MGISIRCEIQLPERIAGFAAAAHRGPGSVSVITCEFTSSEDGNDFISRLDKLQACFFRHIPNCPPPAFIDHLLMVIRPDFQATAIVNDLRRETLIRPKRKISPGEPVMHDDILDIVRVDIDVPIPPDCGLIYVQSFGWRKSLFFDLTPLVEPPALRDYDVGMVIGAQHADLMFQDQLRITDQQWQELFRQHWFPFRFLPSDITKAMLNHATENWDIDVLLTDAAFMSRMEESADPATHLLSSAPFAEHRALIGRAFERFRAGDYESAVALLFPRIEGILRSIYGHGAARSPGSAELVANSTGTYERSRGSTALLLMPEKFRAYLKEIYFKGWQPGSAPGHVSRHTVSHGVAPESGFNKKAAVLGVLTVLQLSLYF